MVAFFCSFFIELNCYFFRIILPGTRKALAPGGLFSFLEGRAAMKGVFSI
jgi:hypothetical protein